MWPCRLSAAQLSNSSRDTLPGFGGDFGRGADSVTFPRFRTNSIRSAADIASNSRLEYDVTGGFGKDCLKSSIEAANSKLLAVNDTFESVMSDHPMQLVAAAFHCTS